MAEISVLFIIRRIILMALLFFPQRFWFHRGWKFAGRIRQANWRAIARSIISVALIAIIAVLADRIFFHFIPAGISARLAPPIQLWLFTSIFAFFCIKLVHGAEWLWLGIKKLALRVFARTQNSAPEIPSRRTFFRYTAALVGAAPFAAALYGYARERLNFEVVRVDVPIASLPPALDGLRIVQLSDIHAGDLMPAEEIRRAVEMANAETPHLAVITGDLVSGPGDPLDSCIAELSRLRAPLGTWGCNGNHEIYAGAEDTAETLFERHGMRLLRHAVAQLSWNGAALNLVGVDYQRDVELSGARMPHLNGIEALLRRDMPNILLSHNPNSFYRAAELGIDLTISGHTHGGQVTVEILNHNFSPARFMTKFIAGLYSTGAPAFAEQRIAEKNAHLYVNRGLGTLGIPARLGAVPEITVLTLRSASPQG